MPIYEYNCLKCEKEFEKIVYGGNHSKIECPHCQSKKTEKKFSVFGMKSGGKFIGSSGNGCSNCDSSSPCARGGGCGCK